MNLLYIGGGAALGYFFGGSVGLSSPVMGAAAGAAGGYVLSMYM